MFFVFKMDDVRCIYAPDTCGIVFDSGLCCEDKVEKINDLQLFTSNGDRNDEIVNELSSCNYIDSYKRPLRTLYLSLTYNCNLNCKYCICHNSFGIKSCDMSKEILIQAIEKFVELSEENTEREVVLYGGEPTLRKDLIKLAYEKCRAIEKSSSKNLRPARFILCTNGILVDQKFCDFLKNTDIYPAVSIDGNMELHDEFRKFPSGNGSYEASVRGYNLLTANGIKRGITMTLGSYNVKKLPELIVHAHKHFSPGSIAINSLLDYESGRNPYCASPKEAKEAFWDAFIVARETGTYIVKHVMDNKVKPFVEKKPRFWGCTGTGGRMAVTPHGKVVPCMAIERRSKDIHISSVREKKDFVEDFMMEYSPFVNSQCKRCIAKSTCGGMCPAALRLKSIARDDSFCDSSIYFTEKLIGLLYNLNKCKITKEVAKNGFFIPTALEKSKIYGEIKVDKAVKDFQYSPNW